MSWTEGIVSVWQWGKEVSEMINRDNTHRLSCRDS